MKMPVKLTVHNDCFRISTRPVLKLPVQKTGRQVSGSDFVTSAACIIYIKFFKYFICTSGYLDSCALGSSPGPASDASFMFTVFLPSPFPLVHCMVLQSELGESLINFHFHTFSISRLSYNIIISLIVSFSKQSVCHSF